MKTEKLKNFRILNAANAVRVLSDMKLRAKGAYQVMRLKGVLDKEVETVEKVRQELLQRYGEKNEDGTLKLEEDGKSVVFSDREAFQKEFSELMNADTELTFPVVKVDDLGDADIEPGLLELIDFALAD